MYICKENPEHEKLAEMVKSFVSKVREKKPKVKVIRHNIRDPKNFEYYLRELEELFGGVATAEYRKYGVTSLPAIVYKDHVVLQGEVPSLSELVEALAYEGLRVRLEGIVKRAPEEVTVTRRAVPVKVEIPIQKPAVREVASAQSAPAHPAAPPLPEPQAETPLTTVRQEDRLPTAIEPPQTGARVTLTPVAKPPAIEVEELVVADASARAAVSPAPLSAPAPRRACLNCALYRASDKKCLLHRVTIQDPTKPICR